MKIVLTQKAEKQLRKLETRRQRKFLPICMRFHCLRFKGAGRNIYRRRVRKFCIKPSYWKSTFFQLYFYVGGKKWLLVLLILHSESIPTGA